MAGKEDTAVKDVSLQEHTRLNNFFNEVRKDILWQIKSWMP